MKILLVHNDNYRWATTIRAENLKKNLDDDVDIVHADSLPRNGKRFDVIQFLFSGGITKYKDYILEHNAFTTLASHRTMDGNWDNIEDLKEIYSKTTCVCHNPKLASLFNGVFIPNGVDTELFKKDFVVGFVGNTIGKDDHKGYELVSKACSDLGLKLIKAEGLKHEEMADFYRSINCLVIPSLSEGCNNPTLEALAMNIPVISTRVGIAEELDGVFMVSRTVEAIRQALRKLSGRIQILEEYSWDKIAKRYKDVWIASIQGKRK